MSEGAKAPTETRRAAHLSRAAAHDLRGRLNGLVLLVALLEDHADPMVGKAVERLRRVTGEITELASTLEAVGELFTPTTPGAIEGTRLAAAIAKRVGWTVVGATKTRVVVDAAVLADALGGLDDRPHELAWRDAEDHVALRVEGVRPRLGSAPSLPGLRLELATSGAGGEVEVDEAGMTLRLRKA